jgi:hypothetical protein
MSKWMSYTDIDDAHVKDHMLMLKNDDLMLGYVFFAERVFGLPWALIDRQSKCTAFYKFCARIGLPPTGMRCYRVQSMLRIFPEMWRRRCGLTENVACHNADAPMFAAPRENRESK